MTDTPATDTPAAATGTADAGLGGWFNRQHIATKLKILFGVSTAATVIIAGTALFGLTRIDGLASGMDRASEEMELASQVHSGLTAFQLRLERYAVSGNPADLGEARNLLRRSGDRLRQELEADALAGSPVADDFTRLRAEVARTDAVLSDMELAENRTPSAFSSVARASQQLADQSQTLEEKLTADLVATSSSGVESIGWIKTVILILTLFVLLNAWASTARSRREITGRIDGITAAMRKLVGGDRSVAIPGLDRGDEIGEMARALAVFKDNAIEIARLQTLAAEAAQAELARQEEKQRLREDLRAQKAQLLKQLADRFEKTVGDVVGGVAAASSQLQVTATSMASAAEQSAHQTGEVSSALSEASSGVTAAAAASDEFAMSIGEISRQAATSAELARAASEAAGSADATISALTDSAQQVGQIVELISSIAQRTNLLALNASIEAARGGEAGRGFAVVASEVKELAAQTSKATEAVARQIRAIQDSTGASVSALRSIGQQIEQLEATSVSIAAAVDQQSIAGQDLARSIDLAARSTDEVSSNIVHVRETTLATGAAASQVLTSSTELEQQAATLKAQMEEFLGAVRAA